MFGQDDQQNDKVGQGDQLREIVGQESLYPPQARGRQGSPV